MAGVANLLTKLPVEGHSISLIRPSTNHEAVPLGKVQDCQACSINLLQLAGPVVKILLRGEVIVLLHRQTGLLQDKYADHGHKLIHFHWKRPCKQGGKGNTKQRKPTDTLIKVRVPMGRRRHSVTAPVGRSPPPTKNVKLLPPQPLLRVRATKKPPSTRYF